MIFGKTKLELKVGIFVFIGFVILVIFVLSLGNFKTWSSGYLLNFDFNFINGVKIGAPVRFAGVDVGEVKEIHFIFIPEGKKVKVSITGWVKNDVRIPVDSTVWVNTLGLLGEKYVEIMPGKDFNKFVMENQTLAGNDPIAMHEVAQLAKDITTHIDESIVKIKNKEGTLGKLFYEDTIYNELEALIMEIRKNPWKLFRQDKKNQ